MCKPNILVVGSLNLDYTISTDIFPRQGQTVISKTLKTAPGGKGNNQAVQMARLGANVTMCGKLGNDSGGKVLFDTLKENNINTEHILFSDDVSTGSAFIILEEKDGKTENRILVVPGANHEITKEDISFLKEDIKNYDMVVLQLEIPMEINVLVAQYAYENNVPVMLNSAPSAPLPKELLKCITYISPNEHEAKDLTGVTIEHQGSYINIEDVKKAANILHDQGVKNVLITLGSYGAALVNDNQFYISEALKNIDVKDPTAAGDSFVGAFSYAICNKMNIEEALSFANHVAALTVTKVGALPSLPTIDCVNEFIKKH